MADEVKTEVRFRSAAFNTSEPRQYFINPCCYGDDLCRWLIHELRSRGFRTADIPEQEDFGWYFTFYVDDSEHCFIVGYEEGEMPNSGVWRGWLERKVGFFASLLGARKRGISPEAVNVIDNILSTSDKVHDVSWNFAHEEDGGRSGSR